jgi:hypothetical protein
MIDFDTLYKNIPATRPLFLTGNVKKTFFSKDKVLAVFPYSVVIRAQIWLSIGIRETAPNNDS